MAPLLETWPASQLPERAQISLKGTKRKGWDGDLKGCELLKMMQYRCEAEDEGGVKGRGGPERWKRDGLVRCWEVERLFRRCKDRDGTFMVETTAWEGTEEGK